MCARPGKRPEDAFAVRWVFVRGGLVQGRSLFFRPRSRSALVPLAPLVRRTLLLVRAVGDVWALFGGVPPFWPRVFPNPLTSSLAFRFRAPGSPPPPPPPPAAAAKNR